MKKKFIGLLLTFAFAIGFTPFTNSVFAADPKLPFQDSSATTSFSSAKNNAALGGLIGTMYKFANTIAIFILGVCVLVIVHAGFKMATSQGDSKVMEQAKHQIIGAGIGMGVALLAMLIVAVFTNIYGIKP